MLMILTQKEQVSSDIKSHSESRDEVEEDEVSPS